MRGWGGAALLPALAVAAAGGRGLSTGCYLTAHDFNGNFLQVPMKRALLLLVGLFCWVVISWRLPRGGNSSLYAAAQTKVQRFQVQGTVKQLEPDGRTAVIEHQAISNYMPAMTMAFRVKDTNQLVGLHAGDAISFRLLVTRDESWIDHVIRSKLAVPVAAEKEVNSGGGALGQTRPTHPLMNYTFTNELGQPITLAEFRGQALGITFFFTRCPIPEYCPRLSRNFEEASRKLSALPNGPTNWHFLSVSIDPQMDSPSVLRASAQRYHYDPKRWSFLTGPVEKVRELARQSGVTYEPENGLFNHNFRTLIIDPAGHLQTSFPIGGNLSDAIVNEIVKAAAVTDR